MCAPPSRVFLLCMPTPCLSRHGTVLRALEPYRLRCTGHACTSAAHPNPKVRNVNCSNHPSPRRLLWSPPFCRLGACSILNALAVPTSVVFRPARRTKVSGVFYPFLSGKTEDTTFKYRHLDLYTVFPAWFGISPGLGVVSRRMSRCSLSRAPASHFICF